MSNEHTAQDELLTVCETLVDNPHPMIAPSGFLVTNSQMRKLTAAVHKAKESEANGQTDDGQ